MYFKILNKNTRVYTLSLTFYVFFLHNLLLKQNRRPTSCIKFPVQIVRGVTLGETGTVLNTRKKEHLRNTKTAAKGSRIANHAWSNNDIIDFENTLIIDKGTFRTRKTLEAWYTKVTPNADNNSCPLPGQYNILFNKHS